MSRVVCIAVLSILIGSGGPAFAGKVPSSDWRFVEEFARHCLFEDYVLHKSREKNLLCRPFDWWQYNYGRNKQPPV
jgi:hypothetical protein